MEKSVNFEFRDLMEEMLQFDPVDVSAYSPLVLAYIGDCVYDLIIKSMVINQGNRQVQKLHRETSGYVQASAPVSYTHLKGLLGHSDADVLLHAIMDALLGAAALGDIGKHFPDTDPAYKGISSIRLLEHVADLLEEHQFLIENIDATIIAQRPKMRPYIDTMRENIAKALKIESDQINVKATTEEGLGFTGSGEGISSQAICMLEKVMNYSSVDVTAQTGGCAGCQGCKKA